MRALPLALVFLAGCLADAAPEAEDESDLHVGLFEAVPGANHLRAPLRRHYESGYTSSVRGSSGRSGETVNVLFYDIAGREGRWLLPDANRLIAGEEAIQDSGRVRAVVYQVAEDDTDGDGRLGAGDARTIAIADPTGRRLVRIVEGAERLRQVRRLDDDTVLILYDAPGTVGTVEVNVDDLTSEAEATMPPVPKTTDPEAGA